MPPVSVSLPVIEEIVHTLTLASISQRSRNGLKSERDGDLTLMAAGTVEEKAKIPQLVPNSKMTVDVGLKLRASWCNLPKENRDIPLGQDAYFISYPMQTIGVADGVGGVSGADSGVYARKLMKNGLKYVMRQARNTVDPMKVLKAAFKNTNARGASTACIITLKDNSLHAVNLGDSGFMVIRGDKTVYKSTVQQVRFNYPFQLGNSSKFRPSHAEKIVVDVEPGDVLIAGTDGLFDNLFDAEIEEIVKTAKEYDKRLDWVAESLGKKAIAKSLRNDCVTPFSMAAAKNGLERSGGKYDDVTVIVGSIY